MLVKDSSGFDNIIVVLNVLNVYDVTYLIHLKNRVLYDFKNYIYLYDSSRKIFAYLQFLQQQMQVGTYKQ